MNVFTNMAITRRNKQSLPRFNLNFTGKTIPKDNTPKGINLMYRYKNNPDKPNSRVLLKYSTGLIIRPKSWDKQMQFAKAGVYLPEEDAKEINDELRAIKAACKSIIQENPDIEVKDFKSELDIILGKKPKPRTKTDTSLLEFIKSFIERSTLDNRTITKFSGVKNHLKDYESHLGSVITFEMVNPEFSHNFANWLYLKYQHSQNHVSKIIQTLKQFVSDAHDNGYHSNTMYQSSKFGIPRIQTSKHFLEIDDLEKFEKHQFTVQRFITTQTLWLIGAWTGLRISDLHRLDYKKHFKKIDGVLVIDIDTFKGRKTKKDTQVIIPVLPQLEQILNKIKFKIPKAYSSQKMNDYIKKAMEIAEIDRNVKHLKSKAGNLVEAEVPLYSKVTNHTARYTFINIMLNDFDIPPYQLQKITGQSLKVLMGYERGDKKKNAIKVLSKVKNINKP